MDKDPIEGLLKKGGLRKISNRLVQMKGSELNSLLMHVMAERAYTDATDVFARYQQTQLSEPSPVSPREMLAMDLLAYRLLPEDFCPIELSPVMPLGTNSVLGGISQKNVLGGLRNSEVLADPTTALALETGIRRQALLRVNPKDSGLVQLATSMRSLRLQNFDDVPGFVTHFRALALATAGRDVGHEEFETDSLKAHLGFYLEYLRSLNDKKHYNVSSITVALSDVRIMQSIMRYCGITRKKLLGIASESGNGIFASWGLSLPDEVASCSDLEASAFELFDLPYPLGLIMKIEDTVIAPLRVNFPNVRFVIDLARPEGVNYYTSGCFKISAQNATGQQFPLADGGLVNWTQRLLVSRKERLLTSGMGTQLFCSNFKE